MANVTTKVDLVINRLSQQKYDQLSAAGLLNPNQLYVTSGGADAVLETREIAGKALSADVTAADISSAIGLDQYLTAIPSDYKTYSETQQTLSDDGYATQDQLNEKSTVSVDNEHADANILHVSQEDYNQLVVDDAELSNTIYVVSSDYVETYGQQIKNVADPTDLSDAATKGYVDSNFQPVGNYLTAVPSDYKTYAATLSSLSSTYALTSHNHDSAYKSKQTAVPSPTISGSTTSFIDTITQDANGVITATKKIVLSATTSQAGIVQLNDTLTSTSTTLAATANAVKTLNDKFDDYVLLSDLEDGIEVEEIEAESLLIDGKLPSLVGHTHSTSDIIGFPSLVGQTMPTNPTQNELTMAVKKIWQALGGSFV